MTRSWYATHARTNVRKFVAFFSKIAKLWDQINPAEVAKEAHSKLVCKRKELEARTIR